MANSWDNFQPNPNDTFSRSLAPNGQPFPSAPAPSPDLAKIERQLETAGHAAKFAATLGALAYLQRVTQAGMTPEQKIADNRKTLMWALIIFAAVVIGFFGLVFIGGLMYPNG